MVNKRAALEGLYLFIGLGSFLGYHLYLIFVRGRGWSLSSNKQDVFGAGKLARALFVDAVLADAKDAILGVQTIRNALMACSFMSAISAILLTTCMNLALDQSKIDRITKLAANDLSLRHVSGTTLTRPSVIVLVDILALFASFLGCAQSVRLYVHLGFYLKAMSSKLNVRLLTPEEPLHLVIRAGMAFTFGLRSFYFFIPVTAWLIGPTPMLITGVLLTLLLMYLDRFTHGDLFEVLDQVTAQDPESGPGLRRLTMPLMETPQVAANQDIALTAGPPANP